MKVLTFSRQFPKGHPKVGQPTWFVEKVWNTIRLEDYGLPKEMRPMIHAYEQLLSPEQYLKALQVQDKKHHTVRAGSRWKAGDMASLRIWSGAPYRSKQIEFAQVEVKKVWQIEVCEFWFIDNNIMEHQQVKDLAKNDGLLYTDFVNWFNVHPKKKENSFRGQIICWSPNIDYTPSTPAT
jgi:hypothetical protein